MKPFLCIGLALTVLGLIGCGLGTTKHVETTTIHIGTDDWKPALVDSMFYVILDKENAVADSGRGKCDTVAGLCQFAFDQDPSKDLFLNIGFYSLGVRVGGMTNVWIYPHSNILSFSWGSQNASVADSIAKVYRLRSQCVAGSANCLVDARLGGHNYRTTVIGNQTWMAENLDYPRINTTATGSVTYCYNDSVLNCARYGRLYNWNSLFDDGNVTPGVQGICPGGWHLPTDSEWTVMELAAGMEANDTMQDWRGAHAKHLRAKDPLWGSSWQSIDADNSTGFSALPTGLRDVNGGGGYLELGLGANYWTSSSYDLAGTTYGIKRKIGPDQAGVRRDYHFRENAYSIRCIKN